MKPIQIIIILLLTNIIITTSAFAFTTLNHSNHKQPNKKHSNHKHLQHKRSKSKYAKIKHSKPKHLKSKRSNLKRSKSKHSKLRHSKYKHSKPKFSEPKHSQPKDLNYFDKGYIGINGGVLSSIGKSNSTATSSSTAAFSSDKITVIKNVHSSTSITQTLSKGRQAIGAVGGIHAGYNKVFNDGKLLIGFDCLGDLTKLSSKSKAPNSAVVSPLPSNGGTITYVLDPDTGETNTFQLSNSLQSEMNSASLLELKINMNWSVGAGAKFGTIIDNSVLLYTSVHWMGSQWTMKGQAQQPITVYSPGYSPSLANVSSTSGNALVFTTPGALSIAKKNMFSNGVRFGCGLATPLTNNLIAGIDAGYTYYQSIKAKNTSTISVVEQTTQNVFPYTTTSTYKHKPRLIDVQLKLTWQFNGLS